MASELKANAIYKIIGMNCYAVPSNSSSALYKVCFDEAAASWTCTCRHGEVQASRGLAAHCCHVAAVQVSIKANLPQKPARESLPSLNGNGHERKMEVAPSGRAVWMR